MKITCPQQLASIQRESARQCGFYQRRNEALSKMWADLEDTASEALETNRALFVDLRSREIFNPTEA